MRKLLLFALLIAGVNTVRANNISVTGISVTGSNVTFNLSWDNSWNTANNINPLYPNNYDGVWLFVKYQNNIDNLWKHAKLSNAVSDHSVSGGGATLQIETVTDSMGVFVRRTNAGSGNISNASVTLKMGPQIGSGQFNIKVFGTEMVYVPQDTFQLGDGSVSGSTYFNLLTIDATREASAFTSGTLFTGSPLIPAAFPAGYNAFWCMKYEIGTEQWADFLNTLTYDQQAELIPVAPNSALGTKVYGAGTATTGIIEIDSPGLNNTLPAHFGCDFSNDNAFNQVNDGQNIPVSGISKGDFYAFLDWAGLRPMTELEFEKAARGKRPRVLNEYAWGSANLGGAYRRNLLSNLGTPTETFVGTVVNGRLIASGSSFIQTLVGPARSGLFATGTTGREASGASFWGIMELSGNVWEITVETSSAGASFNGLHGDGMLTTLGAADVANWPSATSAAAGNTGTHVRGGSFFETAGGSHYISYRSGSQGVARVTNVSGRGVRTP